MNSRPKGRRENGIIRSSIFWIAAITPLLCVVLAPISVPTVVQGLGWHPRVLLSDDNVNNTEWSGNPFVAIDPLRNVHVAWDDKSDLNNSGLDSDVYYRRWDSSTESWGPRSILSGNSANSSNLHGLVSDSRGNVHVVWRDLNITAAFPLRNTIHHRMLNVSSAKWEIMDFVLNETTTFFRVPRIARDPFGDIHLVANNNTASFFYMNWNGTTGTWGPLSLVSGNGTVVHNPTLSLDNRGNVHAVWFDATDIMGSGPDSDIFYKMLDRSTGLWGSVHLVTNDNTNNTGSSNSPEIDADPFGRVHIVWEDDSDMDGAGSDFDIFYRSLDSSTGGWGSRRLVTDDNSNNTEDSTEAQIATDLLGNAHIVWKDASDLDGSGNSDFDVFYKKWNSITGDFESRNEITDPIIDTFRSECPIIATDSWSNAHVVWIDGALDGSGDDTDVFYRKWESNIVYPDYVPVNVSPSETKYVYVDDTLPLSANVFNQGNDSSLISTIAFYNSTTPTTPFFQDVVPPVRNAEKSAKYQTTWRAPSVTGTYRVTIEVDYQDTIDEIDEANNRIELEIVVISIAPARNLRLNVSNESDIFLNWTAPSSPSLDHYLIYRSVNQTDFDFGDLFHNTSTDPNPLLTYWIDYGAANSTSPCEYYYTIRAVDIIGRLSTNSNTVGKWTKSFPAGASTFSLPLEPLDAHNVSWYSSDIPNVDHIRWMSSKGEWVTHNKGSGQGIDDSLVTMGEAYEVLLTDSTVYTFSGYPASMIRFRNGLGDTSAFMNSLSVSHDGSNVTLSWNLVPQAMEYRVLRADTRFGFHDSSANEIASLPSILNNWTDYYALSSEMEHYYMIIPVDSNGDLGSSTYSIGVIAIDYRTGTETFALPLKSTKTHMVDWFCDFQSVSGMAYMTDGFWKFHSEEMPSGVFDVAVGQSEGFQISKNQTPMRFIHIGH
jgi:hypothetical protein